MDYEGRRQQGGDKALIAQPFGVFAVKALIVPFNVEDGDVIVRSQPKLKTRYAPEVDKVTGLTHNHEKVMQFL